MTKLSTKILVAGALSVTASVLCAASVQAQTVRVALGDLPGIESIHTLAAIEHAKAAGTDIELIILNDEDLAAQAIVGGQADIGIGAPYTLIQEAGVPVRMFVKISNARFFPVVNKAMYSSWEDLDGQAIAVQARGSGTEAIMMLMAKRHGITYSEISYVPGSEVRRGALLQGTINASIVDAANRQILLEEAHDRFMVLPIEDVEATDEALFATAEYLASNAAAVDALVEALLTTARAITENPALAVEYRNTYNLLPDLGAEADAEILAYYTETAEAGALAVNGGGADAVQDDFDFFAASGQLQGDPATLNVADFWDFSSVDRVLANIGAM
ncbi:MAG: ABC transporter substrate-binding protein [Cucumibacter sp.]